MRGRCLEDVIEGYHDEEVREFLTKPCVRSVTYHANLPIKESIEKIIAQSLREIYHEEQKTFQAILKSDLFIFPDVHGRLDLLVQNLFVAGLVDKEGNWKGENKTAVLLGDLIHRGTYSVETLIYVRALQNQAYLVSGKLEVLMGNHEHCVLNDVCINFENIMDKKLVGKIVRENIMEGHTKLAYADNEKNLICVHAGIEKEILKWALRELKPELSARLAPGQKNTSAEIFQSMQEQGIEIEDIADWMNRTLKKDLSKNAPLLTQEDSFLRAKGVLLTRKKDSKPDVSDVFWDKPYKFNQFVGHTTTNYGKHLSHATFFGGVKKINHRFYLDYDLLRGNMAFVAVENHKVYQMLYQQKGLYEDCKTRDAFEMKIPNNLRNTMGCYPGNTKPLDMEKWELQCIAILPSVDPFYFKRNPSGSCLKKGLKDFSSSMSL
jgi:hypothetical protein